VECAWREVRRIEEFLDGDSTGYKEPIDIYHIPEEP
jgi:hypothetical protein